MGKNATKSSGYKRGKTGINGRYGGKSRMEEVYTKAARLFRAKGYLKTTMDDIAKAMNIQKASLYYYVKDKETLLFQILERTANTMAKNARNLPMQGLSTKEKFKRFLEEHFQNVLQFRDEIPLLINETKNLPPNLKKTVIAKREEYEAVLFDVIREGMSNKTFGKHDEYLVAFLVLGGIYWLYQWFSPEEFKNTEMSCEKYSKLLFDGLLVKK